MLSALPAGLRTFALHFNLLPRCLDDHFSASPRGWAVAELWEGVVRTFDLEAIDEPLSTGSGRFPCIEEVTVAVNFQLAVTAAAKGPEEFDPPILTRLRDCRYFRFTKAVYDDLDSKSSIVVGFFSRAIELNSPISIDFQW